MPSVRCDVNDSQWSSEIVPLIKEELNVVENLYKCTQVSEYFVVLSHIHLMVG